MKKTLLIAVAALLLAGVSGESKTAKPVLKKVVYCTDLDCENCAKKIRENVSFEKGVKDLSVDVPTKAVEIQFDSNKTDTTQLRKALNKLGYEAKVITYE